MIVIDASALVGFLLGGASSHPRRFLERAEKLHAPHLADIEVMHALRRIGFQRPFAPGQVEGMLVASENLKITLHPHRPLLNRVWALRSRFTAHDALYVALAESMSCPLLTGDGHLARAAEGLIEVKLV